MRLIQRLLARTQGLLVSSGLCLAGCAPSASAAALEDQGAPVVADAGASGGLVDAGGTLADSSASDGGPPPPLSCGTPLAPAGTPLRRHPSLHSMTPTSVRIAWTTATMSGIGALSVRSAAGGPTRKLQAQREAFPTSRTDESEDFAAYVVDVTGLQPDTTYCYELAEGQTQLATGYSFHTAWGPAVKKPLRILAFGDSGTGSLGQRKLRDQMLRFDYDVFLHLGDIAYPNGTWEQFDRYFFDLYEELLGEVPIFAAIGNHEYVTQNGQPFIDVFYNFEQALRAADQERYYSFDYGDVHFVVLDSNSAMMGRISSAASDDMLDWLKADLARSLAPWKIALFHHPAWSSGSHGNTTRVLSTLVPALEEGGVDLVLNGHDHSYERTVPVWDEQAAPMDPRAITYIVAGAGGASLYRASGQALTATVDSMHYSFLRFTVDGCVGTGQAIAEDGSTIDAFTLNGCEN